MEIAERERPLLQCLSWWLFRAVFLYRCGGIRWSAGELGERPDACVRVIDVFLLACVLTDAVCGLEGESADRCTRAEGLWVPNTLRRAGLF